MRYLIIPILLFVGCTAAERQRLVMQAAEKAATVAVEKIVDKLPQPQPVDGPYEESGLAGALGMTLGILGREWLYRRKNGK
jgi:hypothetical protein